LSVTMRTDFALKMPFDPKTKNLTLK